MPSSELRWRKINLSPSLSYMNPCLQSLITQPVQKKNWLNHCQMWGQHRFSPFSHFPEIEATPSKNYQSFNLIIAFTVFIGDLIGHSTFIRETVAIFQFRSWHPRILRQNFWTIMDPTPRRLAFYMYIWWSRWINYHVQACSRSRVCIKK